MGSYLRSGSLNSPWNDALLSNDNVIHKRMLCYHTSSKTNCYGNLQRVATAVHKRPNHFNGNRNIWYEQNAMGRVDSYRFDQYFIEIFHFQIFKFLYF